MTILKAKPDIGVPGTAYTLSASALPAGKDVSIVWNTANVTWVVDPRPDSVDYLGRKAEKVDRRHRDDQDRCERCVLAQAEGAEGLRRHPRHLRRHRRRTGREGRIPDLSLGEDDAEDAARSGR